MTALPIKKDETNNVITLSVVDGKLSKKPEVRYNKDGSIDKRYNSKVAGVSSEVYPLVSQEEIKAVVDVLNRQIENATTDNKRHLACRNKMMFLVGINLGIRASDLCSLKYSFFMNQDGTFKDFYKLKPKKTKKTGKYVTLYFNQTVKKSITDYVKEYPIEDIDGYIFKSQKGNAPINEKSLWQIIVNIVAEAGIERNVGSHTLRKTFGYHVWHGSEDKEKALVMLMTIFNHNSIATTKKYIGIMGEEIEDVFNGLNLGLDFV